MTDSRVTPQAAAVEAAAKAIYKREWEPLSDATTPNEWQSEHCHNVALTALTAAAPLLCQPLQDEIDRLRAELQGAQSTISHMTEAMSWIGGHDRQGLDHLQEAMDAAVERDAAEAALAGLRNEIADEIAAMPDLCTDEPLMVDKMDAARGVRFNWGADEAAAVPVGTGNPTQPRADG